MRPVVAIIAPGQMGSGIGRRLTENGVRVTTSLAGRSKASGERARAAGMEAVSEEEITAADIILSILPPADALPLAERLAASLRARNVKPVYVDCNAISPHTVTRIADAIAQAGCPFVDAGIIGGPPRPGGGGPAIYASGAEAFRFAALRDYGLDIRVLDGAPAAASALKMSYAGITKGFTALGTAMMLAATRAGSAEALRTELQASQPALHAWLMRQIPGMYAKAYRWVGEMDEIAGFVGEDEAARQMFDATSALYARLAEDFAGEQQEIEALRQFLKPADPST
jgi:3-hydroxyisobutyrate dehydrogenase-like beta-hydroxyacid dehydrogenase